MRGLAYQFTFLESLSSFWQFSVVSDIADQLGMRGRFGKS